MRARLKRGRFEETQQGLLAGVLERLKFRSALYLNHDVIAVRENLYFREHARNASSVMDGNDD